MSEQREPVIDGEPLDLNILLDFATITPIDAESASEWWNEHATDVRWIDALDSEPINE